MTTEIDELVRHLAAVHDTTEQEIRNVIAQHPASYQPTEPRPRLVVIEGGKS